MAGSRPTGASIGRLMRTAPAGDSKVASPRRDTSPTKQKITLPGAPDRPPPNSGRNSAQTNSSSAQHSSQRRLAGGNASSSSAAPSPRRQRTPNGPAASPRGQRTPQRTAQRTPQRTPQRTRTPAGKGDGKSSNARVPPALRRGAAPKSGARPTKMEPHVSNGISPLALVLPPVTSSSVDDASTAQETDPSEGVAQAVDDIPERVDVQASQDSQDNIKVCVRIRPLSASEKTEGEEECVTANSRISLSGGLLSDECWGGLTLAPMGSEDRFGSPPRSSAISRQASRSSFPDETNREKGLQFSFDWVLPDTSRQQTVYDLLGERIVQGVAEGFHGCVFAYGQTGSGKSHTIFGGQGEDRGLLLRISENLFNNLKHAGNTEYIVKLSYLEIYNEKIRDLLRPVKEKDVGSQTDDLRVRHHPKVGVFVEGLTNNVIQGPEEVARLLDYGHKIRVVGRTIMNAASSRSHAVVTLNVEFKSRMNETDAEEQGDAMPSSFGQEKLDEDVAGSVHKKGENESKDLSMGALLAVSKFAGKVKKTRARNKERRGMVRRRACLHSVDLAGSERLSMAGNQQIRQKESKEINKSLWALSHMISRLAAQEQHSHSTSNFGHIPYRNSKLTYLLSNSLMGNCRTVMLACISPCASSWRFTESTLRFAASAKKIRTRPVKNEELDGDLVSSLRHEIEQLRLQLEQVGSESKEGIQEMLATTELLHKDLGISWEEQHAQAAAYENERSAALQSLGLSTSRLVEAYKRGDSLHGLIKADAEPYLVNVCDDPLLSGCLTYMLPRGKRIVVGSAPSCEIQIDGLGVLPRMCSLICHDGRNIQVSCIIDHALAIDDCEAERCSGPRKTIITQDDCEKRGSGPRKTIITEESHNLGSSSAAFRRGSLVKCKRGLAQVFVNNDLVQRDMPLHNGERLRIGHAHVFQAFVPQQAKSRESGVDFIEAQAESLGEQILAKEYHAHLKERIGADRTKEVFRRLQELTPLVDEANEMTDELRGDEDFDMVFKAHVLTDITSTSEDPELAVVMRVTEKPDDVKADGSLVFNRNTGRETTECSKSVWSLQKFMHRLEVMRDLYHEVSNRQDPWGLPTDLDPWADDMNHFADPGSLDSDPLTHNVDHVHHVGSPRIRVESTNSAHTLSASPGGGAEAGSMAAEASTLASSATGSAAGETSHGSSALEVPKVKLRNGSATEPDAEPSGEAEQLALRLPVLEVALQNALTGLAAKEAELQKLSCRQEELQAAVAAKDEELKQLLPIEMELRCAAAERDMLAAQLAQGGRKHSGQAPVVSNNTADQPRSVSYDQVGVGYFSSVGMNKVESIPQKYAGHELHHAQAHDLYLGSAASASSIGGVGSIPEPHHARPHEHVCSGASIAYPGSFSISGSLGASIASLGTSVLTPQRSAAFSSPRRNVGASTDVKGVISSVAWPAPGNTPLAPGLMPLKSVAVLPAPPRSSHGPSPFSSRGSPPIHRTRSQPGMAPAVWPPAAPSQGGSVVVAAVVPALPVGPAQERVRRARSAERLAVPVRRARSVERVVMPSPRRETTQPSAEKVFIKAPMPSPRRETTHPSAEKVIIKTRMPSPRREKTRTQTPERFLATAGPSAATLKVRGISGPAGTRFKEEVHGELSSLRQQLVSLEALCGPPVMQPLLPASLATPSHGPGRESVISSTSGDQCGCLGIGMSRNMSEAGF